MALQSRLFGGDAKLEAAAVSDPAHIVPGASGPHVGKIQLALIQLDRATITQDSSYGPATATAVAAFKQKRNILNTEGKIDNIVGKKTMAALDSEMFAREKGAAGAGGGGRRLGIVGDSSNPSSIIEDLLGKAGIPLPNPLPPGLHWGVDSFNPITPALFAAVLSKFGRVPEFWGRYITPTRSSVLQASEIAFLRATSPNTRLLLIHNPLGPGFFHDRVLNAEKKVVGFTVNVPKEFGKGLQAALNARVAAKTVLAAAGLGDLENVVVYMNIEPDQEFPRVGRVSKNFLVGWWNGMGPEFGGIYGNVSDSFQDAELKGQGRAAFIGDAYRDGLISLSSSFKPFLWGQQPHAARGVAVPQTYVPRPPPFVPNTVQIWQYGPATGDPARRQSQGASASVDLNLATQEAFDQMVFI
ncbi:MAG: peptidoglycan-binding protein [Planctomycetes bacterium]|nr:peptidoglycan-binding protein [Planctomycetota bacterium]